MRRSQLILRNATFQGPAGTAGPQGATGPKGLVVLGATTADSGAIANTAVLTAFNQQVNLAANSLAAGKVIRLRASGQASCAANASLAIAAYFNGTASGIDGANLTLVAGNVNVNWVLDLTVTIRTAGAGGTFNHAGWLLAVQNGGFVTQPLVQLNPNSVNTTIANLLSICATWSVANAGNTATMKTFVVEALN